MTLTEQILDRYLGVLREAHVDYMRDPLFARQLELLRMALASADRAMEAEGLDEAARRRVLRTIVFGEPDEEMGEWRMQLFARNVAAAQNPLPEAFSRGVADALGQCPCGRPDCPDRPAAA